MNDNDKLQYLYNHLLQSGLRESQIGDFNTFATNMADEDKAKRFYDNVTAKGVKLDKDWDTFNKGRTKYFDNKRIKAKGALVGSIDDLDQRINEQWTQAWDKYANPSGTFDKPVSQPTISETGQWSVQPTSPTDEVPEITGGGDIKAYQKEQAMADVDNLQSAARLNYRAKRALNSPESSQTPDFTDAPLDNIWGHIKNLGQAFGDKTMEEYAPFMSGWVNSAINESVANISQKIKDKKPLSLTEQTLAKSAGLINESRQLSDPDAWYSAGETVVDMVPYIGEMAATSMVEGPGALVSPLIKGTSTIAKIGRGALKLGTESAIRAPFMSMLPAEYYRRRAGNYAISETGDPMVDVNSIQSPLEAGYKAYATTFAEVFSEGLGEGGQALMKTAAPGISTFMGKITPKMLRNIGDKNMWLKFTNQFRKAGKWDGPFWEIAEEYANSFIQTGLTGETDQLKQMFTPEGFREVALPMFLTAGAFKAAEIPGKLNYRRVTTRNWKKAQKLMAKEIGEDGVNVLQSSLDKILAGNIDEGLAEINNILSNNQSSIPYLANYVKAGLEYNMMKKSIENDEMDKVKGKMDQVKQMTSSLRDATGQLKTRTSLPNIATFRDTETGDIFILDENNTANLRDQNGLTSAWGVNILTGKKVMLTNEMPLELVDEKRWWDYHEDAYQSIYNEVMNGQQQAEQQVDEEIATDEAKDELAPLGVQEGGNIEFKGDDYSVNRVTPQGVVVTNDKGESFMITPQEYELINKKQREEQAKQEQKTAISPSEQGQSTAQNEQSGNSGQLNNVVNPEGTQPPPVPAAPQTTPWTIGKKTYNIQQIDDDIQFIPFEDGKDDTKAILAEVDTDNYDVEPVVVDVPIPNVPAFAKVKTQKVVKGVSIIAKKQAQQEPLQTQPTEQPSTQTAQPSQVQQEAPIQSNVQLTENSDNEQSTEYNNTDIESINKERAIYGLEPLQPTYRGTTIDEWESVKNGGTFKSKLGFGDNKADVTWVSSKKEYSEEYVKSNENGVLIEFKPEAIDKSTVESGQQSDDTGIRLGRGLKLEDVKRVTDKQGNVLYDAELSSPENNTQSNQDGGQQRIPDSNASKNASRAEQEPKPKSSSPRNPSSDVKQENRESETKKERIVSDDAYEKAREILRKKLNNLNALIDPEMMSAGMTIAAYHLENGITKFADFVKTMTDDFGDAVKPYLKSFYKGSRMLPGMEDIAKEMDSDKDVDGFDLNSNTDNPQSEKSSDIGDATINPMKEEKKSPVEILRANKYFETGEERVDDDYNQEDPEYNQRKVLIPSYVNEWNYDQDSMPKSSSFDSIDKALEDLNYPNDNIDDTFNPYKITKLYIKEAWIDRDGNEVEDITEPVNYDNYLYDNPTSPLKELLGTNEDLGYKSFDSSEKTANSLLTDVETGISSDIISSYNGNDIKVVGDGKYRKILVTKNGEDIGKIGLRIADHAYNPKNNNEQEIGGDFISVEIANNNKTKGRFGGLYSLQFTGDSQYQDVVDSVNGRVKDVIENWDSKNKGTTALDAIEQHSISKKANEAATSPKNDTPEPTDAQKKAGNYKKGHIKLRGLEISIENPKGSQRSGTDKSGKKWSQTMQNNYGYILGTVGKDKDHIDVFIGPDPVTGNIFIVDQVDPQTGEFDEHKIMLGFPSEQDARDAYLSNYEEGWNGLGEIAMMSEEAFKEWVYNKDATKVSLLYDKDRSGWKPKKEAKTQEDRFDEVPTLENSIPNSQKERLAKINAIDFNAGMTANEAHQSMVASGEINEMEGSELSYAGFIARFSTNVSEVVKTMLTTPKVVPSELRDPKEEAIFDSIATISPSSLKSYDDKYKQNIPSVWFISGIIKKDGEGLDQIAQKASSLFNESENAITEQDVYDFLMNYKGLNGYINQPNVDYIDLKSRFEELTGVSLSKKVIDKYNDYINNNKKISSVDPELMLIDIEEDWYKEMKSAYDNQQLPGEDFFTYDNENELSLQETQSNEGTRNIQGTSLERETTGRDDSPNSRPITERGSGEEDNRGTTEKAQEKELTPQQKNEITQIKNEYNQKIKDSGDKLSTIKEKLRKKKADLAQQRNPQADIFGNEQNGDSQKALFDEPKDFSKENIKRAISDIEGELSQATREHKKLIDERDKRVQSIIDNYLNQQDLFNPENNTQDVHNRSGISQPDGSDANPKTQSNVDVVLGNGGTVITTGSELSQSTGGENRSSGSTGGSGLFTPTVGKRDDNQVYQQNEKPESSSNDARDFDGRGNEPVSTDRYDVSNEGSIEDDNEDSGGVSVSFQQRLDDAIKRQREVEDTPVVLMDEANIRETLPVLLTEQQDDVIKAENRFFGDSHQNREKAFGKGILFTNGTGTGKTYTGLGIIKRFAKQGKNNILIVVPSEAKINDWIKDGINLGLNISSIESQQDQGKGIRVTTYAMFVGSTALGNEDFDLTVFDECHRIMDNKNGVDSGTTGAFRQAANVSESYALHRLTGVHPLWIESHELSKRLAKISNASYQDAIQDAQSIKKEIDDINQRLSELEVQKNAILPSLKERAKAAYKKTKVVLLSATPFKSVFNLRYANGVLFDWGDETTYEQASRTMSRVNPEARFFLDNFGSMFEWKYHQLQTKPKSNAEAIAMQEVDFANRMMADGIASGRAIESNMDYSREFPVVALGGADKMNEAFAAIFDYNENARYSMLIEAARKVFFSYERSTQLMESLRAGMMLDRIQKHLDLGRKIVIFHRRRLSNVSAPFESILLETTLNAQAILNDQESHSEALEKARKALEQVDLFREQFPELLDYEQTLSYNSAIEQITERFGDKVLTLNGETKQRDKSKNIADFNNDDSGKDIIIIQEEAGKEGISLHDKSGKHQRVLINLSIPVSSTTALQIEGRIYRIGQESNAIFEYPLLGLDMEVMAFGANVNKKLSTTENLAVGDQSRDLLRSFAEGVLFNSSKEDPSETQGTGGKEADKRVAKSLSLFQKAVLVYNTNQKKRGRRDQREGVDYFATPEPVGQKMVEWADMADNETTLEPSAGHGAISMWFPEGSSATVIEPSFPLFSKLGVRTSSGNKKLINGTFEQLDPVNKFMSVVMNPPFGQAGSMAISHVQKAFNHLYINGRMVALIPVGAMDKKLDQFFEDNQDARLIGEIKLPSVTFDQAGTRVNTRVVIIDKVSEKSKTQIRQELLNQQLLTSRGSVLMSKEELNDKVNELFKQQSQDFGGVKYVDLTNVKTIQELFDKLEGIDMPKRSSSNLVTSSNVSTQSKVTPVPQETQSYKVETVKHTKTGETMHVVRLTNSVPYERYQELSSLAKKNNGYYNKFIKGFHFNGENPSQDIKNFTDTAFKNEQPLRFSLKSSPKTIEVDGVQRPTENSLGQPIHSTEEGIRNFWEWFGDSKVVDEQGRPLVVYHGTVLDKGEEPFSVFNIGELGIHFGTEEQATNRATRLESIKSIDTKTKSHIFSVYLQASKLIYSTSDTKNWSNGSDLKRALYNSGSLSKEEADTIDWSQDQSDIKESLVKLGYEGIKYSNSFESKGDSYIVFYPDQIKSATENTGAFNWKSNDIRFSATSTQKESPSTKTTTKPTGVGMDKKEVENYVKSFEKSLPNVLPTIVVKDMQELIEAMRANNEDEAVIEAMEAKLRKDNSALLKAIITPNAKVYMVASAMDDGMDVLSTYMHEQGIHHGIRMLFGSERKLDIFLTNLYNLIGEERLKAELGNEFEINAERDRDNNVSNKSDVAEEYLARLGEKEARGELSAPEKSIWRWVIERLRKAARWLFKSKASPFSSAVSKVIEGEKLSQGDLDQLIYDTVRGSISQIVTPLKKANKTQARYSIVTTSSNNPSSNNVDDLFEDEAIGVDFAQGNKSKLFNLRETWQDKMLTVKKLIEEVNKRGGNIPAWANPYIEENLSASKSLWEMRNYNDNYFNPLLKQVAEVMKIKKPDGEQISEHDISTYLKAKHSIERHDKGINALSEDPNSDWSREKLEQIVEDFESIVPGTQLKELYKAVNKATKFSLDKLLSTGLISKDTYDEVYNRYEYYVPLRSWQHDESSDPENIFEYLDNKPVVSPHQKAVQKAKGRSSEAEDPLGFIQSMAHTAIADGNRNMIRRAALDMIRLNNHMKDLFSTKSVWYVKDADGLWTESEVIPSDEDIAQSELARKEKRRLTSLLNKAIKDGEIEESDKLKEQINQQEELIVVDRRIRKAHYKRNPSNRAKQHEVEVIEHGKKYILVMEPKTANALNGNNAYHQEWQNAVSRFPGGVNRWLTQNFTAKNPQFIPVNWIRDMGYASVSHIISDEGNIGKFYRNVPHASAAIHRGQLGTNKTLGDKEIEEIMKTVDLSSQSGRDKLRSMSGSSNSYYDNLYNIFGRMGGMTGYVHLEDPKYLRKEAVKEINRMLGYNGVLDKAWQSGVIQRPGKLLDYLANMSENMSRYATFLASLESGKTLEEAARDAKDITVNFNRKGTATGLLSPFYGFFNATVQGGHNLAHLAAHNKKKFMVAAAMFMTAGFFSSMIVAAMGGDDDKKIPDYVLFNNMVIPTGAGKYITIPLPPGFRSLWATGVIANQVAIGRKSISEGMFKATTSMMDAFSPFTMAENEYKRGEVPMRSLMPTFVVPFYDVAKNEDFTGRKIYREPFTAEMKKYTPDSELGINANPLLDGLAKDLNKVFGGNEIRTAKYIFKDGEYKKAEGASAMLRGAADFNPSVVEHIVTYYLGGRGKFFNDIYKTAESVVNSEKEVKLYNIPVVKRLITEPYEYDSYSRFIAVREFVEANNYFTKKAEGNMDFDSWVQSIGNPRLQEMIITFDIYNDLINTVNEIMELSSSDKQAVKKLKATRDSYIDEVNKTYDKLYKDE